MDEMNLVDWIRTGTEEAATQRPECPEEHEVAAFFDGRLTPEAGSRLRDHLADCDQCLGAVAFLSRNAEAERPDDVPVSLQAAARARRFSRAPASSARVVRRWAVAAALVTITSVAIWKLDPAATPGGGTSVRSGAPLDSSSALGPGAADRGPEVVFPYAGATIPSTGVDLRWTRIPTAVSYQVRIVTLDGDVVWEERVFGTQASLPAEVRLLVGETYLARVSALLAGGKTLDSGHVRFFVRDP